MKPNMQLVLGVDGGGTKTAAWLAAAHPDDSNEILGRGTAGPGNPRAVGFETAQRNILTAIAAAFEDAKLGHQPVAVACFGLAGAGRPEEQQRIKHWAHEQKIAPRMLVVGDAEPVLAAAAPDNVGIALICGTGSLAWGRNAKGIVARTGGWGYLIGDEGSGYAIAVAGLRAAMQAADGRGPATTLLTEFQRHLAIERPEQIIDRIYDSAKTRRQIAELAAIVFAAAEHDDVARELLIHAAADLATMVKSLATRLGFSRNAYRLALAGGVLIHQPTFRQMLLDELARMQVEPETSTLVAEPVRGAIELARRYVPSG